MLEELSSDKATGATGAARGIERRTVLKGAAWSVPVIAAAVAAPAASASVNNFTAALSGVTSTLVSLRVLNTGAVATSALGLTVPTTLAIVNGAGALSGSATITVTVSRPTGVTLTAGKAYGFGVDRFDNVAATAGQRTASYQSGLGGEYGFPVTTFTTVQTINVGSGETLNIPIVWGLAGSRAGLSVNALSTFPVSILVTVGGRQVTASGNIIVPVGAGIL